MSEISGSNSSPFEAPSSSSDDDEKKSKKKKKTAETAPTAEEVQKERTKKQQVAEQTKSLWGKLVGETEPAKADKSKETKDNAGPATPEQDEGHEVSDENVENLSESEQAEVVAAYVEPRLAELRAGRSEQEDPADAAAREANIELLEALQSQATEPVPEAEDQPEEGLADVDLREVQQPDEFEPQELDEEQPIDLNTKPVTGSAVQPSRPTSQPTSSPPAVGGGSGSGGTPPPRRPSLSGPMPGGQPSPNFYTGYAPAPASPNLNPNVGSANYQPNYAQNPNATYLLVGGLVGYFIGRRRGRIKTEKRMRVVQRKLEKQISETQRAVAEKEAEVQKLAREQYWQKRTAPKYEATASAQPAARTTPERSRPPTPEHPVTTPPFEAPRAAAESRQPVRQEAARAEVVPRQIQELSKPQLLEMGEKVKVGDTNLKRIYEAKLITESGLKRLVHEHLEHRDIRRGLAREFLAKELSYERDPHFRDLLPVESVERSGGAASAGNATSGPAMPASANSVVPSASSPSQTDQSSRQPNSHRISNGLLAALTLIALGLAIYAVLLGATR